MTVHVALLPAEAEPAPLPDLPMRALLYELERRRSPDLALFGADFARQPAHNADALLELLIEQALGQWRPADATFWQRVKFRSHLLRAMAGQGLG